MKNKFFTKELFLICGVLAVTSTQTKADSYVVTDFVQDKSVVSLTNTLGATDTPSKACVDNDQLGLTCLSVKINDKVFNNRSTLVIRSGLTYGGDQGYTALGANQASRNGVTTDFGIENFLQSAINVTPDDTITLWYEGGTCKTAQDVRITLENGASVKATVVPGQAGQKNKIVVRMSDFVKTQNNDAVALPSKVRWFDVSWLNTKNNDQHVTWTKFEITGTKQPLSCSTYTI